MSQLCVRDLMTEKVFALGPDDDIRTVHDLMDEKGIRHVPVVDDDGQVIGIVSQRDLLRRGLVDRADLPLSLQLDVLRATKLRDVMTPDVETVEADEDIRIAARTMLDNKYGCLPVVEEDQLAGILTEADFVRYVAEQG